LFTLHALSAGHSGLIDSAAEARLFRFKEDNERSLTANIVSDGKRMGNALLMEARQN
jgi:hypothetical protein